MGEVSYTINISENGELESVLRNGEAPTKCEMPSDEPVEVIASWGRDPRGGDGVELVHFGPHSHWCVHWFCNWYCW